MHRTVHSGINGVKRLRRAWVASRSRPRRHKSRESSIMSKVSAGLVMYRQRSTQLEVLLVHLGGPFWAKKDAGAWFVPKGEINPGEDELAAAKREFAEETGLQPAGTFLPLGSVKHKSGKTVLAWAFEGDCDPSALRSNTFQMEWPPRSGKTKEFPEIDRADFFTIDAAREKMHPAEFAFLPCLADLLSRR
jgi:predicted NUDIX family NTP pyrophosphohydrolase